MVFFVIHARAVVQVGGEVTGVGPLMPLYEAFSGRSALFR